MDPVNFINRHGQERMVSSVEGAVNANAAGFYDPASESGKRLKSRASAEKAAETKAKRQRTTTRKASAKATGARAAGTKTGSGPNAPEEQAAADSGA